MVTSLSCASYTPRPLAHPTDAGAFERRRLDDPRLGSFVARYAPQTATPWPPKSWGLAQLTVAALFFHPDLDAARAAWREANADRVAAGQYPNPTLDVAAGYDVTTGTPSPWILSSLLGLELALPSRRAARRDQARWRAEHARLQLAGVAWQVRSRLRRRMERLYTAVERQHLLEQQQVLRDDDAQRVSQRYESGDVSAFERMQARLAARAAQLEAADARGLTAVARLELATAVGLAPEALDDVTLSFGELDAPAPAPALGGARGSALINRADLLAALADYAEAEAALRLEVARQYPDIHIGLGYEYDQGDSKWSLGLLSITLPALHGNRGPIAAAEARRAAAAARFDALQLRVLEAVARATSAYRSAVAKQRAAAEVTADVGEQLRRASEMQAAGELSELDLVAIRLEANAAALAELSAASEARRALGALEDAVQRPVGIAPSAWQSSPQRGASESHPHAP